MFDIPTLLLVLGSSAIGSIHPCIVSIITLVYSMLLGHGHSRKKLLIFGALYIFLVFAFLSLAGLGINFLIAYLPLRINTYSPIMISILLISGGLIEVKDYYWYGKFISVKAPDWLENLIHKTATKRSNTGSIIKLSAQTSLAGLLSSGMPYIGIIAMLRASTHVTQWEFIGLYNLMFILPFVLILIKVLGGMNTSKITKWKEVSKQNIRLLVGLLLIVHGWVLMLITNGTINFR